VHLKRHSLSLSLSLFVSLSFGAFLFSCPAETSPATRLRNSRILSRSLSLSFSLSLPLSLSLSLSLLLPLRLRRGGNRSFLRYKRRGRIRLSGRFVNGTVSRNKQKCALGAYSGIAPFAMPVIGPDRRRLLLPISPPYLPLDPSRGQTLRATLCYVGHSSRDVSAR